MIYVASLFSNGCHTDSDLDKEVRHQRYEYTMKRVVGFMKRGWHVYSLILHCYEMSNRYNLPKDYTFWKNIDRDMISRCDKVLVLMMSDDLGNWVHSEGMTDEINYATSLGKPIEFAECKDYC